MRAQLRETADIPAGDDLCSAGHDGSGLLRAKRCGGFRLIQIVSARAAAAEMRIAEFAQFHATDCA